MRAPDDRLLPWERPVRAEDHVRTAEGPDDYCTGCGELWPCSFRQGYEAVSDDRLRAALDEAIRLVTGPGNGTWTRSRPIEEWQRLHRLLSDARAALQPAQLTGGTE